MVNKVVSPKITAISLSLLLISLSINPVFALTCAATNAGNPFVVIECTLACLPLLESPMYGLCL